MYVVCGSAAKKSGITAGGMVDESHTARMTAVVSAMPPWRVMRNEIYRTTQKAQIERNLVSCEYERTRPLRGTSVYVSVCHVAACPELLKFA